MRLDPRSTRLAVLAAWSICFGWLWATGEVVRYLGPRTEWVVPVGAVSLAAAAFAYSRGRTARTGRVARGEAVGLIGLLVPVALVAMLAHAQLGSLAASNKLSSRGIDVAALARFASKDASAVSFLQLKGAEKDSRLAGELDIAPGRSVELLGFVSQAPGSSGSLVLSRFYITCCVADAIPLGVTIEPLTAKLAGYRKDQWLDVTGVLAKPGGHYVVRAERVRAVKAPSNPYLSFAG
ncbi:MAG: hypothetical protein QOG26_287 [Solirubrobacterales bacterium]|nr:hypothetical protein [Solirubrobacterales bacterium]